MRTLFLRKIQAMSVITEAVQLSKEDSTTYITRLRTIADSCEYSEMENEQKQLSGGAL